MNKRKRKKNIRIGFTWWFFSIVILIIVSGSAMIAVGVYYLLAYFGIVRLESISTLGVIASCIIAFGIVGALVAGIIYRNYTRPLKACINAISHLAEGDYSVRVRSKRNDKQMRSLENAINTTAEELGNTEIMRNDFINDVSHEYKTPVSSILGYARLLKSSPLTKTQTEYVDIIIEESRHLASMTTNVLLLNKFENTEIVTDKKPFSLDEQLRRCFQHLQNEWLNKDISIVGDFNDVTFYGNEEILSHIWSNIVSNAIKFTDKGGEISCSVTQEKENAVVVIKDNGCGMDEETQKHIFDKFYQHEGSGKTEGNGLGLALAKRAAELCEGEILVKSEPDLGTEFTVILPNNITNEEPS